MRHRRLLLLGLWAACAAGCLTDRPATTGPSPADAFRFRGLTGPDVVRMQTALLEGPIGDRFMNEHLWQVADDQVVGLEEKALLGENGFRVGQVGGVTPPGLQARLTSERSCSDPVYIEQHSGQARTVRLGPVLPECAFQIHLSERSLPVALEQAAFAVRVVPTLTPDGRTRLRFTPEVRHGAPAASPQPSADRSGWTYQNSGPTETYADLSWEVTLEPNEYVVVGAREDRPDTLGHRCFIRPDEKVPRQRLLVIRTAGPVLIRTDKPPAAGAEATASPSLALQAAVTTFRGKPPPE